MSAAVSEVTIYPNFNALYYCYFLQGLSSKYGNRLTFSRRGFPNFGHDCLAFRVSDHRGERKVYIHAHDSTSLDPAGLDWCDVFGKVNLDPAAVPPAQRDKVVATGPIFPVRLWGIGRTAWAALHNLALANARLRTYRVIDDDSRDVAADRSLFACYRLHLIHYAKIHTHKRLPLSEYRPGRSEGNYVFFSSGLWPETHRIPEYAEANREANENRVTFIETCLAMPDIRFEGGFWGRKRVPIDKYQELTSAVNFDHQTYITKTRTSAAVFNTPAFKRCHSWKLGEFLALGKAIISLPLARAMPESLVHGENVHFVDGSRESIQEALRRICGDDEYRRHLEVNARAYYETWLEPSRMISRLVDPI